MKPQTLKGLCSLKLSIKMMPQYHFLASTALSAAVFYFAKSPGAAILCFLSGFAIDADHLLDFGLYRKKITIDGEIFQHFFEKWGKICIFLHSFELLIPIALTGLLNPQIAILSLALALGLISHLMLDFLSYELHPLSHFLAYRIAVKFELHRICGEKES